ncbi:MAG: NADH-quinone oxidoreductase subunit N [Bacteroidetes bacterium]|nr:NADH-quinone oxidoreductase subunit N [Bacteroidota bacterium]
MASLIVLSLLGIFLLFLGLGKNKKFYAPFGIIGLLIALVLQITNSGQHSPLLENMVQFDSLASVFSSSMLVLTLMIFLLGIEYYKDMPKNVAENYSLMLFSLVGGLLMTSFANMVTLFLGIEILSIPLYILSGSKKKSYRSNEASFKYFLLGSFASAFLLFGIALVYGVTASFDISAISRFCSTHSEGLPPLMTGGMLMIFLGLAFKVAAVPFHFWSPDVYEGSPTLITAFMSTVVKTAGFAALYRLISHAFSPLPESMIWMLWILTFLTLAVGNLSALWQSSFKRLLAYSSIANSGFLLLALLSGDPQSPGTILFYTFTYSLATLTAFSLFFSVKKSSQGSEQMEIFTGLWKNNPFLAIMLTFALFSLAGIPPLAGFFGKYLVFFSAIRQDFLWISAFAILMAVVGIYYYFSVLRFVFSAKENPITIQYPKTSMVVIILCGLLLVILGIFPSLILSY